ncbi:MAG TPA: glutamine synthetase III, partial [Myxococcota bacterium]|nr:glutamine synthetase III [Myxococcota bacterium]
MSTQPRFDAISTANSRSVRVFDRPTDSDFLPLSVSEFFGRNTFSLEVMAKKLPKPIFKRVRAAIQEGHKLGRNEADAVAQAVKEWGLENGCTHFTHWFQPMTGSTAEKHDAFLTFDSDGSPIERFTGDALIQSEPDASSFPSGGMRTTFEARGYTAWDPSSPIFIMENPNGNTLCIPSVFISYTGEALDKKTPLLRSMEAIHKASVDLLGLLGSKVDRVVPTLGCEQEYFLVDRAYWGLRPDLAIGGRTVIGARPPKGQSLEDHYFGSIPPRVQAFMQEVETELYKLGVPAKTRHNEVAPAQYEIAPIFDVANVAVDHNQLTMEILRRVALRHDFKVLLHEKPFAGVNGSGKHNNWSLSADGENLLDPGQDPSANLRFLAVLASVLLGVHRHGGLLRASVATYGNDFRLGANEAPPAIMSVFLGDMLSRICDALASDRDLPANPSLAMIELGVSSLPHVAKDTTDRNRTSPVAFTGNKFEFRAVGSSQNPAWPMTVLNTIVADAMGQIGQWIREAGGGENAAFSAIKRAIKESSAVRFDGNGYSEEWVVEAARRGLPNHRKTPEALGELRRDGNVAVFVRNHVLTAAEVEARYNVLSEQFVKAADIETDLLRSFVDSTVVPAAIAEYRSLVGLPEVVVGDRAAALAALLAELRDGRAALD